MHYSNFSLPHTLLSPNRLHYLRRCCPSPLASKLSVPTTRSRRRLLCPLPPTLPLSRQRNKAWWSSGGAAVLLEVDESGFENFKWQRMVVRKKGRTMASLMMFQQPSPSWKRQNNHGWCDDGACTALHNRTGWTLARLVAPDLYRCRSGATPRLSPSQHRSR